MNLQRRTTTMFEITRSELIKLGYNEYFNKGQITLFDDEYSLLKKMLRYDDVVHEIVSLKFFGGFEFDDNTIDKRFKKLFFTRFVQYEINAQTMESFAFDVSYTTQMLENYIIELYANLDKYLSGESVNSGNRTSTSVDDNRSLETSLADDNINMNVDNTELDYGDTNRISRSKNIGVTKDDTKNNKFSIDELKKSMLLFKEILDIYGENCF